MNRDINLSNKAKIRNSNKIKILITLILIGIIIITCTLLYLKKVNHDNAVIQCKEIIGLINQEKYKEANQKIENTKSDILEVKKNSIIEAFIDAVKEKQLKNSDDITEENVETFKSLKKLSNSISIETSSKEYKTIKYIDAVIQLEKYVKYNAIIKYINTEDFSTYKSLLSSITTDFNSSSNIDDVPDKIQSLKKIDILQYGKQNYGISELNDIKEKECSGLTEIYNGLQKNDSLTLSKGKKITTDSLNKFIIIMDAANSAIDNKNKDFSNLPIL